MGANLVGQGIGGRPRDWSGWRGCCGLGCCSKRLWRGWQVSGCPKGCCRLCHIEHPASAQSVFKARVSKGACFPRWRAVKWRWGLLAWVLAVSKRRGLSANLPACVCSGGGLRPTVRAADTASPWARRGGWSGEVASPAVVVGRPRRAADAIVGRKKAETEAL